MNKNIGLVEFWTLLNHHDWYYQWSDDHSVWARGKADYSKLKAMAGQSDAHQKLFDGFENHYFSGPAFGEPFQAPIPNKPEGEVV